MTNDPQANHRLEYELAHRVCMNWSDSIMRWRQISIPLAVAIIAFFLVLDIKLWFFGWILGLLLLLYWWYIERRIDEQIVALYTRIIELEKEIGAGFYSQYIFNNLNRQLPEVEGMEEYLDDGTFNYDGLLQLANDYGRIFIDPRGQNIQLWIVSVYAALGIIAGIIHVSFVV